MNFYLKSTLFICLLACIHLSCSEQKTTITVKNDLDFARKEIVQIPIDQLQGAGISGLSKVEITDQNGARMLTQITSDQKLLLQTTVGAKSQSSYTVRSLDQAAGAMEAKASTFSRIVPERIDDYAWENDKVAFRTYGPEAQRITEANEPGGTLSSGIDCWLKRVDYPIINKWYKQDKEGISYHKDHGEGLDNYHVGPSRGCGGIGLYRNDTLYTSKNFQRWNTIDEGPLQTNFTLSYDPWTAGDLSIKREEKAFSLDLGNNLVRVEVTLESDQNIDHATVGIAIHDPNAQATTDKKAGWFSVWSPHEASELGTSIVVDPKYVIGSEDFRTDEKDKSHLLVHVKPVGGKFVYYTGFTWMKSGQFAGQKEWQEYLGKFSQRLASPLSVSVN
ncbi:MAG: DUF4861 family protein [Cyclobacteriaceae bacterium]